jgi:pyrophosphatase PpaX
MMRPLRAVLFDLDGTLIDSVGLLLASMRYAFDGFDGKVPTDREWVAGIGTPLMKQIYAYGRTPEESEMLRDRYREFQVGHHDLMISAFAGVAETLETLRARGLRMALVTSKGEQLAHFFEVLVGLESTEHHKPSPEPVLLALQKLGVAADEAVFVGDSPHDIGSGNAAGVTTIAALWGPFTREQFADATPAYWLTNITELPELLDGR